MKSDNLKFDGWWQRTGQFLDPDLESVSWADKRKGLAMEAFRAGLAGSGNYVANDDTFPTKVTFANGRTVEIVDGHLSIVQEAGNG